MTDREERTFRFLICFTSLCSSLFGKMICGGVAASGALCPVWCLFCIWRGIWKMKFKKFITIMQAAMGIVPLNKRELLPPGRKLWRPPGWVRAAVHVTGRNWKANVAAGLNCSLMCPSAEMSVLGKSYCAVVCCRIFPNRWQLVLNRVTFLLGLSRVMCNYYWCFL